MVHIQEINGDKLTKRHDLVAGVMLLLNLNYIHMTDNNYLQIFTGSLEVISG